MPQSKRNKIVTLSKTQKKGREKKTEAIQKIREWTNNYERIYVLTVANMRNAILKEIREALPDSQLFFGKNKLIQLALGRSRADEQFKNAHKIAARVQGQCGLLFTNASLDKTTALLGSFERADFARTGDEVTRSVVLKAGTLRHVSHALLSQLRALSLPVEMRGGLIEVARDADVCEEGQRLTSEQARILKFLGLKLATFRIQVQVFWDKKKAKVHRVRIEDDSTSQDEPPTKSKSPRSKSAKAASSTLEVSPEDVENPSNTSNYSEISESTSAVAAARVKRKKTSAKRKETAEPIADTGSEGDEQDVEME